MFLQGIGDSMSHTGFACLRQRAVLDLHEQTVCEEKSVPMYVYISCGLQSYRQGFTSKGPVEP